MDLFSLSATSSPMATTCSRDPGQRPVDGSNRPPDASYSPEKGFSGSPVGRIEQAGVEGPEAASPLDAPLSIGKAGRFVFASQEALVQATTLDTSKATKVVPSEEGPVDILGAGGSIPNSREWAVHVSAPWRIPLLGQHQTSETGLGLAAEKATHVSSEPVSGEGGTHRPLTPAVQKIETPAPVTEGDSSVPNFVGKETHARLSEAPLRSAGVKDETAEGVAPSKEGGRTKGDAPDAGPRTLFQRMEITKATAEPTEQQVAEPRTMGRPSQGEAAASWSGKEGTPWKQEVQIELPSRPLPSQPPSTQPAPTHSAQSPSNGALHVVRNAIHMRIHDEELGPMRWHVKLNGERITAEAVVETTRVQELLRTHQDLLESKLNALGVQVEDFDVSVDQGSNRYAALLEQQECGPSEGSGEDTLSSDDIERSTSNGDLARDRGLDLYV